MKKAIYDINSVFPSIERAKNLLGDINNFHLSELERVTNLRVDCIKYSSKSVFLTIKFNREVCSDSFNEKIRFAFVYNQRIDFSYDEIIDDNLDMEDSSYSYYNNERFIAYDNIKKEEIKEDTYKYLEDVYNIKAEVLKEITELFI